MKQKILFVATVMVAGLVQATGVQAQAMKINPDGNVGVGIDQPLTPIHVFRDDDTREMLLLESNQAGAQDRAMIQLINNGGIRFQFDNPVLGTAWRFQAATGNNDRFEITKVGTGQIEMAVDEFGNLEVQGAVVQLSDRNAKQDIVSLEGDSVLERLSAMPVSEWAYKDNPATRHIGPMAQDFHAAFGVGKDDRHISAGDMAGVSIVAIQALNEALTAKSEQVNRLQSELDAQRAQTVNLEARLLLVEELLRAQAASGEVAAR